MIGGKQTVKIKLELPGDIPDDVIERAKTNLINSLHEYVKETEAQRLFKEAEGGIQDKLDLVKSNLPPESSLASPQDKIITPNGKVSH